MQQIPTPPLLHPPAAPPSVPVGLGVATQIVAATWMALAVGRAIAGPVAVSTMTATDAGSDIAFFVVEGLATLLGLVQLLALVIGGLWLYLLAEAVRHINREAWHERAAYWGFLGWIVPIVNLWFPYQVVHDVAAALGARTRPVVWWWAGWIATGILTGVEALTLSSSSGDLTPWLVTSGISALVTVGAGILWIRIVGSLTRGARRLATEPHDGSLTDR